MRFDKNLESISSDLLIIGGGPPGCFAALKAKEAGVRDILVVDKGYVGKSGCATFGAGSFKGFIPQEDSCEIECPKEAIYVTPFREKRAILAW